MQIFLIVNREQNSQGCSPRLRINDYNPSIISNIEEYKHYNEASLDFKNLLIVEVLLTEKNYINRIPGKIAEVKLFIDEEISISISIPKAETMYFHPSIIDLLVLKKKATPHRFKDFKFNEENSFDSRIIFAWHFYMKKEHNLLEVLISQIRLNLTKQKIQILDPSSLIKEIWKLHDNFDCLDYSLIPTLSLLG